MGTKHIVPRAEGEGGIGTATLGWGELFITNTSADSSTQGGKLTLTSNDGAAMQDGSRLGVIEFKGAESSSTLTIGARIEAICDAAWTATENGTSLKFFTTDADASESLVLTLDSNKLATFTGSVAISADVSAVNATLTGYLRGPASFVIDPATHGNDTGTVVIAGNLQVDGTTTTVNSTVVTIDDPIFSLGGDTAPGSDDDKDRGIEFRYYSGSAKIGFFGYDDSASAFTFIADATNSSEVFSGSAGNVIFGNITGTLQTAAQANVTSLGTLTGLTINGDLTLTGASYNVVWDKSDNALEFSDDSILRIGDGSDLDIFHSSNVNFLKTQTNSVLKFVSASDADILKLTPNGAVDLYFNNNLVLTTTNSGIKIPNSGNIGCTSDTDLMTLASGVLTIAGELDATSLDISGNADIDGTLNVTETLTVDKTATSATEIAKFKVSGTGGSSGNESFVSILPGSDNFTTQLRLHTNNTGSTFQTVSNKSGILELATTDSNPIVFKTNDSTRLTISNAGVFTFTNNIIIPDSGTIGCASDTDLLTLSDGVLTVAGNITLGSTSLTASNNYVVDAKKAYSSGNGHVAYFGAGDKTAAKIDFDTVVVAQNDVPCLAIIEGNTAANTHANEQSLRLAVGDNNAVISTGNTSGGLHFFVNRGTNASGFVTNSGTQALHIANSSETTITAINNSDTLTVKNTGTYGGTISFVQGSSTNVGYVGSIRALEGNASADNGIGMFSRDRISFYTDSSTPDVTIHSDGRVASVYAIHAGHDGSTGSTGAGTTTVGTTLGHTGFITAHRTNATCLYIGTTTDREVMAIFKGTSQAGKIRITGDSTVAFESGSDYRLKEDLKDFNGLDIISKLKVYNFNWIGEDRRDHGLLAHEVQEVLPDLVSGEKDGVLENGKIDKQTLDYGRFTPMLIKAVQEQQAVIEDLKARIEVLEG